MLDCHANPISLCTCEKAAENGSLMIILSGAFSTYPRGKERKRKAQERNNNKVK
jgi:hypothetical protein